MLTEPYVVDKSAWGPGPWQDEPDRVDFEFAGFACFLHRRDGLGHWCGYVGVPREHPLYGKGYDDVDVEVHGGLTYADRCQGDLCHTPQPGMPDDVWWFGFDAARAGDLVPGMEKFRRDFIEPELGPRPFSMLDVYRDLAYMRAETECLASQLAATMKGVKNENAFSTAPCE